MSDKYTVELEFIKNVAPVFSIEQKIKEEDTIYETFVKFKS